MTTLTIAIPTFNRRDCILQRVSEIQGLISELQSIDLLVIDNNSSDGTYEALIESFGHCKKIRILRNEENIRFHGSFLRLIEEAEGEWILVSSDEDEVVADGLRKLLDFLRSSKASFISTQFWIDRGKGGYLYRGSRRREKIQPKEFHASSFYISGLVFSLKIARICIGQIRNRFCSSLGVYYYPHTLLAAHMLACSEAIFVPFPVCKERENNSPNVQSPAGSSYNVLDARWEQFKGINDYLCEMEQISTCTNQKAKIAEMLRHHRSRMLDWLRWGIAIERPDLIKVFDSSVDYYIEDANSEKVQNAYAGAGTMPTVNDVTRASAASLATWKLTKG